MDNARLWFSHLVMLYALLIFGFLASLYIFEPLEHIADFGVSASGVPESINFLRAGPGALFLGMTVFALYGLALPNRLLGCLTVLVVFNACVVAVRVFGIGVDGASPCNGRNCGMRGCRGCCSSWPWLSTPGANVGERTDSGGGVVLTSVFPCWSPAP
ncbi:MAG: hypothetical protein ABI661_02970 [Gammaproteobacteria bacterium]